MAAWASRAAAGRAGIAGQDWVAEALDALDRGAPPPASFADFDAAFRRWVGAPVDAVLHSAVISFSGPREVPAVRPEIQAIQLIIGARHRDPLIAVFHTLQVAHKLGSVDLAAFRAAFGLVFLDGG